MSHSLASRPVLRYSVVAGGVYDAGEVAAVKSRDPLVAHHYDDVVPAALRPMTIDRDRFAYVSYRKNGTIYWTKRRVLLRSGEAILSDGRREIRSRCGNRISMYPLLPFAEDEPAAGELDELVDDPQSGPETQLAALPLFGRGGRALLAFGPGVSSPLSYVPTGALPSTSGVTSEPELTDGLRNGAFGPPLFLNPPGPVDTPTLVDDSGGTTASDDPKSGDPPDDGDRGSDPGTPDAPPDDPPTDDPTIIVTPDDPFPPVPQQPVPMPEPTTLLLVGGGLAGLVMRRMRR